MRETVFFTLIHPSCSWLYSSVSQVLKIQQEPQAILQPASPVSMSQPRPERGSLRWLSSFPTARQSLEPLSLASPRMIGGVPMLRGLHQPLHCPLHSCLWQSWTILLGPVNTGLIFNLTFNLSLLYRKEEVFHLSPSFLSVFRQHTLEPQLFSIQIPLESLEPSEAGSNWKSSSQGHLLTLLCMFWNLINTRKDKKTSASQHCFLC